VPLRNRAQSGKEMIMATILEVLAGFAAYAAIVLCGSALIRRHFRRLAGK
jgi:hypothetical protein